jgi:hypothetical protein
MIYIFGAAYETPQIYLHKSEGEKSFEVSAWGCLNAVLYFLIFIKFMR